MSRNSPQAALNAVALICKVERPKDCHTDHTLEEESLVRSAPHQAFKVD